MEPEVTEGDARSAAFKVYRLGDTSRPLRVYYSTSGTAHNGRDYRGLSGSVTLLAGAASRTINVVPRDDTEIEPPETVSLTLVSPAEPFTLVILPDTQYYVAPRTGGIPEMFYSQTQWIADHKEDRRIAFVLHEGDCTDQNTPGEWARVKAAMAKLDGVVPYALAVGNHDGLNQPDSRTELFNAVFPVADYQPLPSFGGVFERGRLDNSYHYFTAGGVDWLVLSLEFGPRDAVLDWANRIVSRHPGRRVIVVTHTHVYHDNTPHGSLPLHKYKPSSAGRNNNGPQVWEKFVSRHANISFVFNGHVLDTGVGRLVGVGEHGNRVYQMLANYQSYARGGNGFLRLVTFWPAEDKFTVQTYSPFLNQYFTDEPNQFEYDRLGIFEHSGAPYTIDPQAASATVTIVSDDRDLTPPQIESVKATGFPPEIQVRFTEAIEVGPAEHLANYYLSDDVPVAAAKLSPDSSTVTLSLEAALPTDRSVTLTVNGLTDRATPPNVIAADTQITFDYLPVLLAEEFAHGRFAGWTVVDEPTDNGPSSWSVWEGRLEQFSNLFGPLPFARSGRKGTYVVWSDPRAQSWTDYAAFVRIRTPDDDGLGLLFRYQDRKNYYKLELDAERQFRSLSRIADGTETLLASEQEGYQPGSNLDLAVEVVGSQITATLDGVPLFNGPVTDTALAQGTIALYSWGSTGVTFDDVIVRPVWRPHRPISIALRAPEDEMRFVAGSTVPGEAVVDPHGQRLRELAVYVNGTLLESASAPFLPFLWPNVPLGEHTLVAKARAALGGVAVSHPVKVSVVRWPEPPTILLQPASQIVREGDPVVFNVRARGTGRLSYQWFHHGAEVVEATSAALILPGALPADAGDYQVVVSSDLGRAQSIPASLRVIPPGAVLIGSARVLPDRRIALRIVGGSETSYDLERSTDLVTWTLVRRFANLPGSIEYADEPVTRSPARFYRLRLSQ
jgi:hypothetical protein